MFQTQGFHPGRREHAEEFISSLADPASRRYATACLAYIWGTRKTRPSRKGTGKRPEQWTVTIPRAKEIDAALYAVFATIR